MKIAGIIAEYNPFHTGHAYQIQKTKEETGADFIIAVISGDFVQRGAPAFLPKHVRTRMALEGGADLVFELPSTNACVSAEFFAHSGVSLLHQLGCVDILSFGSECGDLVPFQILGSWLAEEPEEYQHSLKEQLRRGVSFPVARREALLSYASFLHQEISSSFLSAPNNILGIEYCKALLRLQSSIKPFTIQRVGSSYHEQTIETQKLTFPSASALRKNWDLQHFSSIASCFPSNVSSYLQSTKAFEQYLTEDDFSLPLRWFLYAQPQEDLSSFLDMNPFLADRIQNKKQDFLSFSQFVSLLKTKELTYTRISRALFHALLQISSVPSVSYARLLGFKKDAAPVLTLIKKHSTLPLVTSLAKASNLLPKESLQTLQQNTTIANLYESVLCQKTKKPFIHEYAKPLIIL